MVNAIKVASQFVASIPDAESPEHTEKREGFYHVCEMCGDESEAKLDIILRDFEGENNQKRVLFLQKQLESLKLIHPALDVKMEVTESYKNMRVVLDKYPEIISKAAKALEEVGIKPLRKPIRGGTDGARLSFMGVPTPNIFTGGFMFHSKKEWIPLSSMLSAVLVIVELANSWAE